MVSKDSAVSALTGYEFPGFPAEAEFDDFTRFAAEICETPVSLISLGDSGRHWLKSAYGIQSGEAPFDHSICAHIIAQGEFVEICDLRTDDRFKEAPSVAGPGGFRYCAGVPLFAPGLPAFGALCVMGYQPRRLIASQRRHLESLGRQLMHLFELRRTANLLRASEERTRELNLILETQISEKMRELDESEERFHQLATHSSEAFWFLEMNPERILYVSPAVEKIWGLAPEIFYENPRAWLMAVHPDDCARVGAEAARAASSEKSSFETEYRIVQPSGSVRWIHYRGTPIRDAEGKILRVGAITQDVTERRETADALLLSEERMRLATQASRLGVWDYDLLTGILTWDDEMFRLYGIGKKGNQPGIERWIERLHEEDRTTAIDLLDVSLRDPGKPFDTGFRIVREDDGTPRHIRAIATIFRTEDGRPSRMIGTNWDVTEDRKREQALAEALSHEKELADAARAGERAKSEFLAVMSHEIRTPLNGILGFADILAEMENLPEESRPHIGTITTSGQALLRILNDILDFSRIEAGQMSVEMTTFHPAELISDIQAFSTAQAQAQGLQFFADVAKEVPQAVMGDPGRIRQILLNLTGNAMKFTRSGSISIGVRPGSPDSAAMALEFYVEDTGPGIPPEKIDHVFEPFTQADSSASRRYGGTGLGLSISRKLAELMGGTLEVMNKRSSTGTRFILRIPLRVEKESTEDTPSSVPPLVASPEELGNILVVEDDSVNLKLISNIIRKLGHEVLVAHNGREALEIYSAVRPACILMDVQMPEMDGIEATRKIRDVEKLKGLSPIFITALTANVLPETRKQCFEAGMNLYLSKPIRRLAVQEALYAAAVFRSTINGRQSA